MITNWKYHLGYRWWEGSAGHGMFAVQKLSRGKGWVVMKVPWTGAPQVITVCASKQAAMDKASELS